MVLCFPKQDCNYFFSLFVYQLTVAPSIFQQAVDDFMPPQETQMIAFMEMLAVFETSRRSMLPERFKHMTPHEVQQQLQVLRLAI